MDIDKEERRAVMESNIRESIRQTEEHGPCDSPNPALVCFAQSLVPTAEVMLKDSNTHIEGLITVIAESLSQGIALGQHSGEWSVLARQELVTALRARGFENLEYEGEEESVLRSYFLSHPLDHFNQKQDVNKEKDENERVHLNGDEA